MRARIVLSCQEDRANGEIARQLRITPQTVGKWRTRFARKRLDGLLDEPRPGAPRTIEDAVVEQVIAKTLHDKPREATHWSSRTMAKASGLSQTAVVRSRSEPWCCAWTRKAKSKPWIARNRFCR
jgi:transposase